jgi:hypothetical protein
MNKNDRNILRVFEMLGLESQEQRNKLLSPNYIFILEPADSSDVHFISRFSNNSDNEPNKETHDAELEKSS